MNDWCMLKKLLNGRTRVYMLIIKSDMWYIYKLIYHINIQQHNILIEYTRESLEWDT